MSKEDVVSDFKYFLSTIEDISWKNLNSSVENKVKSLDKKYFDNLILSDVEIDSIIDNSNINSWACTKILTSMLLKFKKEADNVLENSNSSYCKEIIVLNGLYRSISSIDKVALNESGDAQFIAVQICSIEALRKLKNARCSKVRKVVFQRLGPVECLDEMLSDKKADIRTEGLRYAPHGYEKLKSMTKEIARSPFALLISKISTEYLPMLLANRNMKDAWISARMNERLSSEN